MDTWQQRSCLRITDDFLLHYYLHSIKTEMKEDIFISSCGQFQVMSHSIYRSPPKNIGHKSSSKTKFSPFTSGKLGNVSLFVQIRLPWNSRVSPPLQPKSQNLHPGDAAGHALSGCGSVSAGDHVQLGPVGHLAEADHSDGTWLVGVRRDLGGDTDAHRSFNRRFSRLPETRLGETKDRRSQIPKDGARVQLWWLLLQRCVNVLYLPISMMVQW